jgi:anti-anti-sigma factor
MKIQTEITREALIITCVDSRLDAAIAQPFFQAIQSHIDKGHQHLVIDLSNVQFVDSTGLGALVRCLKEVGNHGQLVLYGVGEQVHSLLQMTRLDKIFSQANGKNEAIDLLLFNKKRFAAKVAGGFTEDHLATLKMESGDEIQEVSSGERRRHQRISHKQIVDEDIIVYCTNIKSGKRTTAVVLNISPGGILLVSPTKYSVGDICIVQGAVGRNFKFKEQVRVRQVFQGKYGLEFMKAAPETTQFLNQLTGAVIMGKGQAIN